MNQTKEVSTLLGDPKKAVLKMSIPMIIAMIINSLYAFIDGVWVAGLGDMALAAIGFVNPVYMVIFGIANGLGAGATAVISKYIGAQDKKEADNSAMHVLILTIILSLIFTILVLIFLKPILLAMGAGPTVNLGLEYGNIFFLGTIFIIFPTTAFGILRAEGNVIKTTYAMVAGAVLNIILDPIFIYTLNLGVAGAAYASILSMALVSIILSYWFINSTYIDFNFKEFIYKNKLIKEILNIGIPGSLEFFFISILAMTLNGILMIVSGVDGVAVYTGGWRFVGVIMVIPIAIGTSTIAIAGANYGAGKFKNVEIAHSYGIKFATLIVLLISVAIIILAPYISYLFAYSPGSERLLEPMIVFLRITCLFNLLFPLGIVSTSVFQGLGKGLNSLIAVFIRALVLQVVFSYVFAISFGLGEIGVWLGIVVGNGLGGIIAYMWSKMYIKKLIRENEDKT
ncbi:MATE family efflux transporter [Methanobrevibacter sp. OttesenSCG-928-K11]|nr:MATE family efflux transporter [Methanobrevibacter sp. OttesenSCG-928-K11]